MRKLMVAVVACTGLGLVAGCQRGGVEEQRQELAETRQEAQQERQEITQEMGEGISEERQEAQEELADVRQDVREQERELAEARQERQEEMLEERQEEMAEGGAGVGQMEEVTGRVQAAQADALVLIVPERNNQSMRFQATRETEVMRGTERVPLTEIRPGDEVRASYMVSPEGDLVLSNIEVQPPGMQPRQLQPDPQPLK